MKVIKRIILVILALAILVIIGGSIYVRHLSNRALPDYSQDVTIPSLIGDVEVFRDSLGKPHIYADNEKDLYLVTGYLMAQDRLWQMDLLRRVTLGRLSEIFGAGFADTDELLRALQFTEKSEIIMDSIDQHPKQSILAFCDGVNFFMEQHKKKLPFEFGVLGYKPDPWKPVHTLNLIGYMAWDLKSGWDEILMNELKNKLSVQQYRMLLPSQIQDENVVFPTDERVVLKDNLLSASKLQDLPVDIFSASNNWSVGPTKSQTGKPIIANDMHLGYNIPGIWYPIHQHVKNTLNVTGFAIPGAPLIVVGHNDSIAWGLTNTYVDNMDFYLETMNPDDTSQYRLNSEWKDFRYQEIAIATKSDDTLHRTLRFTHRGAVISKYKDLKNVVSMQWVGSVYSNEYAAIYDVNRAQNWHSFTESFRMFRSISQNVAYADRHGNIGMFCAAGIPIRNRSVNIEFLPGDTTLYDWQGMVPFEELPYISNPGKGYVSAANNRTVDATYPHYTGTWYAQPYRYKRINELLEEDSLLSVEQIKAIQTDIVNLHARKTMPDIVNVLINSGKLDSTRQKYVTMLQQWSYKMDTSSVESTLYELFTFLFMKNIFADEMGWDLFNRFTGVSSVYSTAMENVWQRKNSVWYDNIHTNETKESFTDVVMQSFDETIDSLRSKYGQDEQDWQWGQLHQLTLQHPLAEEKMLDRIFSLNRGPYQLPGSKYTMSQYAFRLFNPQEVHHGASQRLVYDLSDWDSSFYVIPTGISGIPESPYYCNQTELYVNNGYNRDIFSRPLVEANAKFNTQFSGQ
ncbi:MAG: hypothetical protein GVY19_02040 [Bacteroidetes bacterium]|jgi:penicillin amidase|nr:hypothetical protein [Bacteroidota bacterium]